MDQDSDFSIISKDGLGSQARRGLFIMTGCHGHILCH